MLHFHPSTCHFRRSACIPALTAFEVKMVTAIGLDAVDIIWEQAVRLTLSIISIATSISSGQQLSTISNSYGHLTWLFLPSHKRLPCTFDPWGVSSVAARNKHLQTVPSLLQAGQIHSTVLPAQHEATTAVFSLQPYSTPTTSTVFEGFFISNPIVYPT